MDTKLPLFSVVIPAYNAERFIKLTLESVFRQTVGDYEIVVVNDGSTDGTLEILREMKRPCMRIITQENGGECAARNRGIREARGRYISFLDSDDVWHKNHLAQAKQFFEANPESIWFSSTCTWKNDIEEKDIKCPDLTQDSAMITNWYLEGHVLILPGSCVTVRREEAQAYPHLCAEGYKMFGDALGWAIFAKKYPMVGIAKTPTVLYRYWPGNASSRYNVCRDGKFSEPVKMALNKQAEQYRESDCPKEAKLYYRQFLLGQMWVCITSAIGSAKLGTTNENCLGKPSCLWLKFWSLAYKLSLHTLRWGIRRYKIFIMWKMKRMAKGSRVLLDNLYRPIGSR